jgi:hypothetical protein
VAQGSTWGANTITIQRITTPSAAASWLSPRTTLTTDATGGAGCALAMGPGTTIRCFYQKNTDNLIYYRDSTDDGQTWGVEQTMGITLYSAFPYCYGLAASDIHTLWAVYANYDPEGNCVLLRSFFSTGSWSAWSNEGPAHPAWGKLRGLSLISGSPVKMAAGVQQKAGLTAVSACTTQYTAPATYTDFATIQQLDNPTLGLSLANPGITGDPAPPPPGAPATYYAAVLLADDGSLTGTSGQTRCTVYQSGDFASWAPAASFGSVFQYNACILEIGGALYVFDGRTVYTAPAGPAATDVSDDVLAVKITERLSDYSQIEITLANDAGQYLAHPAITNDATVTLSWGYVDDAGVTQLVQTHLGVLESYQYIATADQITLDLHCRCRLKKLDYPQSRLLIYSGQTIAQLIAAICLQAGLTVGTLPSTPQFSQTLPCFQIAPGETWIHAFNRLSAAYGFEYFVDATGTLRIVEPSLTDPSTWTYTQDTVYSATWAQRADQANLIRVIGQGTDGSGNPIPVFAEAVDGTNLADVAAERYGHVVDRELDTSAKCLIRAGLELRAEQRTAVSGQIITLPNPAHERNDVITLTEADLGLAGGYPLGAFRIIELQTEMNLDSGTWLQHIHLSGV